MFKNKPVLVIGILVLVVAIFFGLRYFGVLSSYGVKSPSTSNLVVPANTVIIQSNSFNPDNLAVKVGTKVTWTNNDSYDHTITSDNGTFDSGHISSGQSFSFTFSKAGTYNYHCAVHTFMTAKVTVTN